MAHHAGGGSSSEQASGVREVARVFLNYVAYCGLEGHRRLTEADGDLLLADATGGSGYLAVCGVCPKDAVLSIEGELCYTGEVSLAGLERTRQRWLDAVDAVDAEATDRRNPREQMGRVKTATLHTERKAFLQYTAAAHDLVRPHVVGVFAGRTHPGPNLAAYLAFMDQYECDAAKRRVRNQVGRSTAHGASEISRVWCFRHEREGHLLPVMGAEAYDQGCWRCLLSQPDDDLPDASTMDGPGNEPVSAEQFRRDFLRGSQQQQRQQERKEDNDYGE